MVAWWRVDQMRLRDDRARHHRRCAAHVTAATQTTAAATAAATAATAFATRWGWKERVEITRRRCSSSPYSSRAATWNICEQVTIHTVST